MLSLIASLMLPGLRDFGDGIGAVLLLANAIVLSHVFLSLLAWPFTLTPLMRLAEKADVVVENFRPDVKGKLGIDYESVRKVNPGIVYGSISGFGQDGPYHKRPGSIRSPRAWAG